MISEPGLYAYTIKLRNWLRIRLSYIEVYPIMHSYSYVFTSDIFPSVYTVSKGDRLLGLGGQSE